MSRQFRVLPGSKGLGRCTLIDMAFVWKPSLEDKCRAFLTQQCVCLLPSLSQHSRMEGSSRITAVRALTSPWDAAWYTMDRSTSSDESPAVNKETLSTGNKVHVNNNTIHTGDSFKPFQGIQADGWVTPVMCTLTTSEDSWATVGHSQYHCALDESMKD